MAVQARQGQRHVGYHPHPEGGQEKNIAWVALQLFRPLAQVSP